MKAAPAFLLLSAVGTAFAALSCQRGTPQQPESPRAAGQSAYLGFDRNIFPDRSALPMLRKTFAFAGYWLSPPPGETTNTWTGQHQTLGSLGFGFLLLYRGPLTRELKNAALGTARGIADARKAAESAKREGFPAHAIIFVDIEEGGRLSDAYHAYLLAWADEIARAGYRCGAYCSGIPVKEDPRTSITTADDIRTHLGARDFTYFIVNDACPPSPGCTFPSAAPVPSSSQISFAAIWQFVRSPREMEFAAHCPPGYHPDGNCYAPGDATHAWFLDVSSALTADPSNGR